MKNLFKKIFVPLAIFTMAIGTAISLNNHSGALGAKAAVDVLEIKTSNFNNKSYADNNNKKTASISGVDFQWESNQVMLQGSDMQWQKNAGAIWNVTALGQKITKIEITGGTNFLSVYSGTALKPSTSAISAVGTSPYVYTFTNATHNFFHIKTAALSKTTSIKVYFDTTASTEPAVSISTTIEKMTVGTTQQFQATTINADDAVINWSVAPMSVATIDESTGLLTALSQGIAQVSATIEVEGELYSATRQLTVLSHEGTLLDPFTVSDAIFMAEIAGQTPTTDSYYISGVITKVKSVDTGTYGNAEFEIKDSYTDERSFLVFRAFANSSGAKFTTATATEIKVGYEVVVYGKILNYLGNTPETNAGSANVANTTHVASINKLSATEDARNYAKAFNDALLAACDMNGNTDFDTLSTIWMSQKTAFASLLDGTKFILSNITASETDEDLLTFITKYTFIASKYSTLDNYLTLSTINQTNPIRNHTNQSNSNTVSIIAIGVMSLSLLIGYGFINKKNKINN